MKVSIFGLGYVGAVSAGCLADLGHQIFGVDINRRKCELINSGQSPVTEERIDDLIRVAVANGALIATTDTARAVAETDISLISVGTPPNANGSPALEALEIVIRQIGEAMRAKGDGHVIVLRSTVPPGTTEDLVVPMLEQASGKKLGTGFHVAFNPEFLREGSSVKDFYKPPFTVIGSPTEEGYQAIEQLYATITAPVIRTNTRVAESVKCLSNAYHAVKITFANEVGAILKSMGIDSREVMSIFCQDRDLNISAAYLKPGFAFGGSCLPKDLSALVSFARSNDIDVPFLGNVMKANDAHIERTLDMVMRHRLRRVALFGLAFKHGTDDLRASPLVTLTERLIGKGYQMTICDEFVEESRLMGKNREFIDQEIPHFERLLQSDPAAALADAEIIVIGHVGPRGIEAIAQHHNGRPIIDLAGVSAVRTLPGVNYEGICW